MPKKGHTDWIPVETISAPVYRSDEDSFDFTDMPPDENETAYEYKLDNAYIKSFSVGGSSDAVATEELTLNYEEIKWSYDESTAGIEGDWNFDG